MQSNLLSDPRIIGPGIWIHIHIKAKNATTPEKKEEFMNDMYMYYNEFPCLNCRKHIREYMDEHPFSPFIELKNNKGREIGMFKWSWMFHNAVNIRLYKPYLNWENACIMYNIDEDEIIPCTDCGKGIDKSEIVKNYFLQKNRLF